MRRLAVRDVVGCWKITSLRGGQREGADLTPRGQTYLSYIRSLIVPSVTALPKSTDCRPDWSSSNDDVLPVWWTDPEGSLGGVDSGVRKSSSRSPENKQKCNFEKLLKCYGRVDQSLVLDPISKSCLSRKKCLTDFYLADLSRLPVKNWTPDLVPWLVTLFWLV